MAKDVDKKTGKIKAGEFASQRASIEDAQLVRTSERNLKRAPDGRIKTTTQQLKKLR